MKIILFEAVDALGRPGDLVTVKPGYYRNYLRPRGFADVATPSNLKRLAQKRKALEALAAEELDSAKAKAAGMEGLTLSFKERAGDRDQLFGSVGMSDLSRALTEKGFEIARRDIIVKGAIKTLGEHEIGVRLHPSVVAPVKVIVAKLEE